MKWTGLGTLACAAMLTIACAGDTRDRADNDNDSSVLSERDDRSVLRDDADGTAAVMPGPDDRTAVGTSGQTATAGQSHGADGDARHFAQTAVMTSHAEVELGKLASERAQSQDVKQFAQMMIRDHTRSGNELEQAVRQHDVTTSKEMDQKHQQLLTKLRALRGAEFDREYMKAMVDGHREVKSMLEKRAGESRTAANRNNTGNRATGTSGSSNSQLDTAVNQWATKALPTVEQHLDRAEQLHASLQGNAGANTRGQNNSGADNRGQSNSGTSRPGN